MKIAIVCGGGFSKGAFQSGYLEAFGRCFEKKDIAFMSGASIGATNAFCFATGYQDTIKDMWQNRIDESLFSIMAKNRKDRYFNYLLSFLDLPNMNTDIPIYVPLTRFPAISCHYYNMLEIKKEDLTGFLKASVNFPIVFGFGRRFGKYKYVDGGLTDNIPLQILKDASEPFDLLIILHTYPKYSPPLDLIKSKIPFLEIDVTCGYQGVMGTFVLKREELAPMYDYGFNEGMKVFTKLKEHIDKGSDLQPFILEYTIEKWAIRKNEGTLDSIPWYCNRLFRNIMK